MKKFAFTYKDLAFLLGITAKEAQKMMFAVLTDEEKASLVKGSGDPVYSDLTCRFKMPIERMPWRYNSPDERIHGKLKVQVVVANLMAYGVPDSMKRRIYQDETCILKARICGKFSTLTKILTTKQRMAYGEDLKRLKIDYLVHNKPKRNIHYTVSEEEQDAIDAKSNPLFRQN